MRHPGCSIGLDNAKHTACAYTLTQANVQRVILATFGTGVDLTIIRKSAWIERIAAIDIPD
jgi:hypothetical protein